MLGQSDIVNLDTVSADFEPSNLLERMFARQLFAYPVSSNFADELKVAPDVATEIPTMANGGITDGGRTYTIHVKQGVMWDTTPPRQVTSGDFVREFKMLCNPVSPVSDPGYFETTIVGMASYCDSFTKVSGTVAAMDAYEEGTVLPGVSAPNPSTIVFKLVQPTSDFLNILALGFCSARPVEYMKYLPDGVALRQHTLSDGPTASPRTSQAKASPSTATRPGSRRQTRCATPTSIKSSLPKALPPRTSSCSWRPVPPTWNLRWHPQFRTCPVSRGARTSSSALPTVT